MKRLLIVVSLLALTGCATSQAEIDRHFGPDTPESYRVGFREGCDSGYRAAGHPYYQYQKDVRRAAEDKFYASGWQDGYDYCKSRYEAQGRALGR